MIVGMVVESDMEKEKLGSAIGTVVGDLARGVLIEYLVREKERRGIAIETPARDLVGGVLDDERQVNGSAIEIVGRGFIVCDL